MTIKERTWICEKWIQLFWCSIRVMDCIPILPSAPVISHFAVYLYLANKLTQENISYILYLSGDSKVINKIWHDISKIQGALSNH